MTIPRRTTIVAIAILLSVIVIPAIAGTITYTKPANPDKSRVEDGVLVQRSYKLTVESQDGAVPREEVAAALRTADSVLIKGIDPLHACDTASDCESTVDSECNANNAGGRNKNTAVDLSWNSTNGTGTCNGTCGNGGTVEATCTRVR